MANGTKTAFQLKARAVTAEERREIREAFEVLDTDRDGHLSLPELETLLRSQFVVACDRELHDLMANMDSDKNGYVDYKEFEEFVSKNNLCRANAEELCEDMQHAFRVFDKDGNGTIDINEFREVMTTIGDKMTDEELEKLMAQADVNADGKIDYKEFCAFMASGIY